jgi:gamma-glutamylcyclotransferase (GGCT)/AIG2-like uncharacterized protein YtfP
LTFSVFTYGTLQVPSVIQAVVGNNLESEPATLKGFQRFKFKEKTFPGIIKNQTCVIEGMLYKNIDEQALMLLDQFEDVAYERRLVDIQVKDKTESAFVYVTRDEYREWLSDEEWSLEEFIKDDLELYLKRIKGF